MALASVTLNALNTLHLCEREKKRSVLVHSLFGKILVASAKGALGRKSIFSEMCFSWRQHKYTQCSGSMILKATLAIAFCVVANRNITKPQDPGFLFSNDSEDTEMLFYLRRRWQRFLYGSLTSDSFIHSVV